MLSPSHTVAGNQKLKLWLRLLQGTLVAGSHPQIWVSQEALSALLGRVGYLSPVLGWAGEGQALRVSFLGASVLPMVLAEEGGS